MDFIAQATAAVRRNRRRRRTQRTRAALTSTPGSGMPEFAAYKPQIEYLVQCRAWSVLLDSFYQVMPFGTVGDAARSASARTA